MSEDAFEVLTRPGTEFEIVEENVGGVPMRAFRHGPRTLTDIYQKSMSRFGERDFLVFHEKRYGFDSFFRHAEALRRHMNAKPGTRVAIAMRNRPEWLFAFTAITASGASAVLVNSRGTPADLLDAVERMDSTLVVADTPRAKALREAGVKVPVIDVDADTDVLGDLGDLLQITPASPDDEAAICFTSGTSGPAKGVILSHRNLTSAQMNIAFSRAVTTFAATRNLPPEALEAMAQIQPSVLSPYPLFHVAGFHTDFLSYLRMGGKLVMLGKWEPAEALRLIEEEAIMSASGSPAMMWDLMRQHDGTHDLSSLLGLGAGGQALPPTLLADIRQTFPTSSFGCGYGQTEMSGPISSASLSDLLAKPGNSGRPVPTIDISIRDDHGNELPVGEEGEIAVRGACVSAGYYNQPEESTKTFRDGWVYSGDVGYLDNDGYLFVVDRKKSIIISGGENISLLEIEFAALEQPGVLDTAALGMPDERMGEIPALAVVMREGAAFDEAAILHGLEDILAAYKMPRHIFEMQTIPRNHMGKIDREILATQIDARQKADA